MALNGTATFTRDMELGPLPPPPPAGTTITSIGETDEGLPVAYTRDERIFVQYGSEGGKRAALWGMDQEATREAVEIFIKDGYLDRFLETVWRRRG